MKDAFLAKLNLFFVALTLAITPLIFNPYVNLTFELPKTAFFRSMVILMLFISILQLLKSPRLYLPAGKNQKFILILVVTYLLVIALATAGSVAPTVSFYGSYHRQMGFITLLHLLLFFFICLENPYLKEKIHYLLITVAGSASFISLYALLQKANLDPFGGWEKEAFLDRVFATLGHPNFLGQYLIMTIFFTIALTAFFIQKRYKILILGSLLLQLTALAFTLSRASFLGLIAALVIAALIYAKIASRRYFHLMLGAFFLFIILIIGVNLGSSSEIIKGNSILSRMVISGENLRSIESRLKIWPVAIEVIKKHPFLGSGPETFALEFPLYQPKELLAIEQFTETADRAHNEILDTAINSGLIGVIIYYFLLAAVIFFSIRSLPHLPSQKEKILTISLIAVIFSQIVANQFGFPTIIHLIFLWFSIALLIKNLHPESHIMIFTPIRSPSLKGSIVLVSGVIFFLFIIRFNTSALSADKAFKAAEFFFNQKDLPQAVNNYWRATEKNPHVSFYQYFLSHAALTYANTLPGNKPEEYFDIAEKAAEEGGKIDNNLNFNAYLLLGEAMSDRGRYSQKITPQEATAFFQASKTYFQKGIARAPNNPRLRQAYALSLYYQNDFANAVEAYEDLFTITPAYILKKSSELNAEEKNHARIFFKLNPEFKSNFLYAARCYSLLKQYERALEYLSFTEENVDTLSTYAVVYFEMGNKEMARIYLEKALKIDPDNPLLKANLEKLNQDK